jgi:hypothetical protein
VPADNKLALNAGWDRELLAIELQSLIEASFDVEITEFSQAEIGICLDDTLRVLQWAPPHPRELDRCNRAMGHDTGVRKLTKFCPISIPP